MPQQALQYRVRVPITGFLVPFDATSSSVTFPAGTILTGLYRSSAMLLGMSLVVWQGRKYTVFSRDLQQRCQRVDAAQAAVQAGRQTGNRGSGTGL